MPDELLDEDEEEDELLEEDGHPVHGPSPEPSGSQTWTPITEEPGHAQETWAPGMQTSLPEEDELEEDDDELLDEPAGHAVHGPRQGPKPEPSGWQIRPPQPAAGAHEHAVSTVASPGIQTMAPLELDEAELLEVEPPPPVVVVVEPPQAAKRVHGTANMARKNGRIGTSSRPIIAASPAAASWAGVLRCAGGQLLVEPGEVRPRPREEREQAREHQDGAEDEQRPPQGSASTAPSARWTSCAKPKPASRAPRATTRRRGLVIGSLRAGRSRSGGRQGPGSRSWPRPAPSAGSSRA